MVNRILKNGLSLLTAGIVLGVLIYLGPSIILSFLVLCAIFSFIASRPQSEKRPLKKIVSLALVLRLLSFSISIFIVYTANNIDLIENPVISKVIGHTIQLIRDFDREIKNGLQVARYLRGEFGNVPAKEISHHGFGFLHAGAWTQGILNYIFGESIFNLLLFPLMDLWSLVIIFYLAKALFDERVAIFSSTIYAIMPSVIIIACTNLRFSLGVFSFLLIALFLARFAKDNGFRFLFMIAIGIILFSTFKEKGAMPLLMIIPLILFLSLNVKFRVKFIFLVMFALFSAVLINKNEFINRKSIEVLQNIISKQTGFVSTAQGNTYKIYDEIVYTNDIKGIPVSTLFKMIPKGLIKGFVYFMFAPFLWQVDNIARFYAYFQILFWYFMFPFAIWGMVRGLVFGPKETQPIILLCGYFIILLSLTMGNEGIAMRYRELITPFFYIFAGSVLCKFLVPVPETKGYK